MELEEEFVLPSGATCLYPKDTGFPEEDINCRCYCEYKPVIDDGSDEESGYNTSEVVFDLDIFGNKDKEVQTSKQLEKGIRSDERRIREHEEKLQHPERFYNDWDEMAENVQSGRLKHWEKEVSNFKKNIRDAKDILKKRGDGDE